MIRPSLRLYLTANALVYFIVGFWIFPEGFGLGFFAILISSVLSLPSLLLLYAFFYILIRSRPGIGLCWFLLFVVTAICTYLPLWWVEFDFAKPSGDDALILTSSIGSGFGSLLLQSKILHKYFKRLQPTIEYNENN